MDLRALFNREVLPRIERGELLPVLVSEGQPNPRMQQLAGTRSQVVEYVDSQGGRLVVVALVHQYVRPDGSLGGSGRPDPKRVLHDGILYLPVKRS